MKLRYRIPEHWIKYDLVAVIEELANAKASIFSIASLPYQQSWAQNLQELELKREVAGTSRIEGAEFTDHEFEVAVSSEVAGKYFSRSQRQARAAINTYRWIAKLPSDVSINEELIKQIHRRIVTGCDDDHCPPGKYREVDQNVTFGRPRHRGVEGGSECKSAVQLLVKAVNGEFNAHDDLIKALAIHYHIGAMHPFPDGNGRTARAIEALVLQRARLKNSLFVAMSNYYYDEKDAYLDSLSQVRLNNHDLTPFIKFGLRGIALQCERLAQQIRVHLQKILFRDVMTKMFGRLRSKRKRALALRQCEILNELLVRDQEIEYLELYEKLEMQYANLKKPLSAFVRDLNKLSSMRAISVRLEDDERFDFNRYFVRVRVEWATEITETEFFQKINQLPRAKTKLITAM